MAELKGRKQQRLDDFTEDLCLHFLLCKIRSSLLFKLLFAARSVLQVPHEASLLPAEGHLMAESFSVILQCDLCMLAMDQATGQDTCYYSTPSIILGKAHHSTFFLCS